MAYPLDAEHSREIAELTGKGHFHVMRDIRLMLNELGHNLAGYIQGWRAPRNGQQYEEFMLNEELTLALITGHSAKPREAVIKRWKESCNRYPCRRPSPQGLPITSDATRCR